MSGMFHSLHAQTTVPLQSKETDKLFLAWPATFLDGFEAIDPETWQLEVTGLVARPQTFTLRDLASFMRIQQNRRLAFADGWAYRGQWEGFVLQELLHRVSPLAEARYLIQTNLSGHQECLPLSNLVSNRALFCMRVGGSPLPALYGGPLRLMAFDHYAHKGLGQLIRLELSEQPIPGFYSSKGYEPTGTISPGPYYAADLQELRQVEAPGEITQW